MYHKLNLIKYTIHLFLAYLKIVLPLTCSNRMIHNFSNYEREKHSVWYCIGEGNGKPVQCSCLENPRDGGAWRAAVFGVAQSRTGLKWLSSSSHSDQGLAVYIHIHLCTIFFFAFSLSINMQIICHFSSVAQSCPTLRPQGLQNARPPCPSPIPAVYSNSCPYSQWCHPTISSSVVPFTSCLQSFPASGSFQMSQFFPSSG